MMTWEIISNVKVYTWMRGENEQNINLPYSYRHQEIWNIHVSEALREILSQRCVLISSFKSLKLFMKNCSIFFGLDEEQILCLFCKHFDNLCLRRFFSAFSLIIKKSSFVSLLPDPRVFPNTNSSFMSFLLMKILSIYEASKLCDD